MAAGSDGALWYVNGATDSVGRITTAGVEVRRSSALPR